MSFTNTTRTRNYISILYPESAVPNWETVLAEFCVPAIVSPLHDKDVNPDGEPKKPHYHIMIMFAGVKSIAQAQAIFDAIGAIQCQPVSNVQGQARYFIHKDNPEKYQYDPKEIKCFSGADWSQIIMTSADRYKALNDITNLIDAQNILSYHDLINYCRDNNFEWFKVACDNTIFLKNYITSKDYMENRRGF